MIARKVASFAIFKSNIKQSKNHTNHKEYIGDWVDSERYVSLLDPGNAPSLASAKVMREVIVTEDIPANMRLNKSKM